MAKSKLLSRIRTEARRKNYSYHIEQAYNGWIVRFIYFHDLKHPSELSEVEVVEFLNHLVLDREVSAITQEQAKSAIHFLYDHVIVQPLNPLKGIQLAQDADRMKFAI